MEWSFPTPATIDVSFTLPSDIYIGIGLGCTSSVACDMIVGNGGGRNDPFIGDFFEVGGAAQPHTDEELGGTNDLLKTELSYQNWASTLRFVRNLDTGDEYDHVIDPSGTLQLVYAWCEEPFCVSTESAHAPGAWNIVEVDLSGNSV